MLVYDGVACPQVNTYSFMHVPTKKEDRKLILTRVMVEKFREAAADPAWVQEFDWDSENFPLQVISVAGESVRSSICFGAGRVARQPAHRLVKDQPDWSTVPVRFLYISACTHRLPAGCFDFALLACWNVCDNYNTSHGRAVLSFNKPAGA